MKSIKTYQDFLQANKSPAFIQEALTLYKSSTFYAKALTAEAYFKGENTNILSRKAEIKNLSDGETNFSFTLNLNKTKIPTNFFKRLVIQESGTLLNNGVQLGSDKEIKNASERNINKMGMDFNSKNGIWGEKSKIHGKAYQMFNNGTTVIFSALEFMPLYDERSGEILAGVRFWQIDVDKPTYMTLYELDGYTEYKINSEKDAEIEETQSKRGYIINVQKNNAQGEIDKSYDNYKSFPIVELKANEYGESELTRSLKEKIDCYDMIISDFGDIMHRIKGIQWVLEGFGGTFEEARTTLSMIEQLGFAMTQEDGQKATPYPIEVPHGAVELALKALEKAIYDDYMGLNQDQITGGSLTNVAIRVAQDNLVKKVGRWKNQQVTPAIRRLLNFAGLGNDTIDFAYDLIVNDTENDTNIMSAFTSGLVDLRTAISKLSFIEFDEVDRVFDALALEQAGVPTKEDDIFVDGAEVI